MLNFGLKKVSEGEVLTFVDIEEIQAGSCDLAIVDPCVATSIHKVITSNEPRGPVNDEVVSYSHDTSGDGNTVTNVDNVFTIHTELPTTSEFHPFCRLHGVFTLDSVFDIEIEVNVTRGVAFFKAVGYSVDNSDLEANYNSTLGVGVHNFELVGGFRTNNLINVTFDGLVENDFDAVVTVKTRLIYPMVYVWSAQPDATIIDGQGTDTVTVETTSSTTSVFDLAVVVTDVELNQVSGQKEVVHIRNDAP